MSSDDRPGAAPSADQPQPAALSLSLLRLTGLVAGPTVAALMLLSAAPEGMSVPAWRLVAMAAWMVIWWLTEAIPIPATALLPIVLMPLLGIDKIRPVAANYGHPLIYLFLGGFLLAAGMQRVGLHRRIALRIVSVVGSSPSRIILGFMIATAFLSMWISNTATTIMMYAVGLSVIDFVAHKTDDERMVRNFGVALMLAIAYSASIGGVGTLIGTPPNALLASFLQSNYDIEITFFDWMLLGVPVVAVMLPVTWLLLTRLLFPSHRIAIDDPRGVVDRELTAMGAMSRGEKLVGLVFLAAASGWILRAPLAKLTGLPLDDTIIALVAALLLFAVPISRERGEFALDWQAAQRMPWGVLLLFGGGLALAGGFGCDRAGRVDRQRGGRRRDQHHHARAAGHGRDRLPDRDHLEHGVDGDLPADPRCRRGGPWARPAHLAVPVALAASMAFMMPVATPPNAIVFSYERMQLADMVRAGFLLNLVAIATAFGLFVLLAEAVFGVRL